jgi:hypothetical protein
VNLKRLSVPLPLCLIFPLCLAAFNPGNHRTITLRAIQRVPEAAKLQDWETEKLVKGAYDTDNVDGGCPTLGRLYLPWSNYTREFHFDSDFNWEEVQANLDAIFELLRENLAKPNRAPWEFGKVLHAIEDFYSHSNYVPLYRAYRKSRGLLPGDIPTYETMLLNESDYPGFSGLLKSDLRTGLWPNGWKVEPSDHGWPLGPGMNKDLSSRDYYTEAKEVAESAAAWYLELYVGKKNTLAECAKLRHKPCR